MTEPSFAAPLRAALDGADTPFRFIEPDVRGAITEALLGGIRMFSYGPEFQAEAEARIARSIPLVAGPTRTVRLSGAERPMILLADPARPDALFAALGPNLPPQLWPVAAPTREGLERDLAAYVARPFVSVHRLSRSLRVFRGSFEELGLEDLDALARVVGQGEQWMDGEATWRSASLEDPWPEDPSRESMLRLRVIADGAGEEHGARRRSISMRTLWSRSVLTMELSPWGYVVFELRWDPAPAIPGHGVFEGQFPDDLPADLMASLLRGGSLLPAGLEVMRREGLTPWVALLTCVMEPAAIGTFEMLRGMMRSDDPDLVNAGIGLAADTGARALLHELACETQDDAIRARLDQLTALHLPPEPEEEGDDDEDDDDEDYDDDDYDDDDESDDEADDEE